MEKGWVDFREAIIRLPAHVTKGKKVRPVPLNPAALALLRRCCLESPHPTYVFAGATGVGVLSQSTMYGAFARAARRAKLP